MASTRVAQRLEWIQSNPYLGVKTLGSSLWSRSWRVQLEYGDELIPSGRYLARLTIPRPSPPWPLYFFSNWEDRESKKKRKEKGSSKWMSLYLKMALWFCVSLPCGYCFEIFEKEPKNKRRSGDDRGLCDWARGVWTCLRHATTTAMSYHGRRDCCVFLLHKM